MNLSTAYHIIPYILFLKKKELKIIIMFVSKNNFHDRTRVYRKGIH